MTAPALSVPGARRALKAGNAAAHAREDGYLSAVQRAATTGPHASPRLSPHTGRLLVAPPATWPDLEAIYASRGLPAAVVDRPAEDALARGFDVEGDDEHQIQIELDRLEALPVLTDAVRWARLYGAGAILMITDDAPDLRTPLDPTRLGEVVELRDYALPQISPGPAYFDDPAQPQFGLPRTYLIQPAWGNQFEVHASRLIPITGDPLPKRFTPAVPRTLPWQGRSALLCALPSIRDYYTALQWALRILERKQSPVYRMKGLAEMLDQGAEGEELVKKRLNLIDLARSVLTTVGIDSEDEYEIQNLGLDGVQATINEMQVACSADTGIAVTLLFGRSPAGMNATGAADLQSYYTKTGHYQTRTLKPSLERLLRTLWAQRNLRKKEPDNWQICFRPLWLPSEKEQAEAAKLRAEARVQEVAALAALVELQGLSQEEVRAYVVKNMPEYGAEGGVPELPASMQEPYNGPTDPAA